MTACGLCAYWVEVDRHRQIGRCHRRAPSLIRGELGVHHDFALWPVTEAQDWCGDWAATALADDVGLRYLPERG